MFKATLIIFHQLFKGAGSRLCHFWEASKHDHGRSISKGVPILVAKAGRQEAERQ